MNNNKIFRKKVKIQGDLVFETAFHIGSGREGELATDMGILRELDGRPILPGSTLKGNFRTFAERLSGYLGFTACLLDSELSGIECVSDEKYRKQVYEEFKKLDLEPKKLTWLQNHTCDICRLFGSPLQASRIFFSDGNLLEWGRSIQVRDGVCIDRDSETARYGAKYDFEVVPKGAVFSITIEMENPADGDLAMVAAALAEWESGFRLGGFTSRGLGRVRLKNTKVKQVDYTDPDQLKAYLVAREMSVADSLFTNCLQEILDKQGGIHA
jgi:CRISPR-associated RAMP protein (TIGR02581 family)